MITVVVMAVMVGALASFLRRSMVGVQMRAAAENFHMARLVGVRSNLVIAVAFALSGLFAGVERDPDRGPERHGDADDRRGAGADRLRRDDHRRDGEPLRGAVSGASCSARSRSLLQVILPEELAPYRDAFVYAGVIAVLLIRPQGLIVVRSRMERV